LSDSKAAQPSEGVIAPAARLVVIGFPGHGKSTVLNEIAGDEIFQVSASGQSCTQAGGVWEERNAKTINISDGKHVHKLEVVDTPGFPDPDPQKAADYYDYVIAKCRQPINGVVFVMKPERACVDILQRYEDLLKEFIYLEVPLIILVNGFEPAQRKREKDADFAKRREDGMKAFYDIARNVAKKAKLHAREILVSFCMDDLEAIGKDLAGILSMSPPRSSRLKTFLDVKRELEAVKNKEEAARKKIDYEERRIEKCKKDIQELESAIRVARAQRNKFLGLTGLTAMAVGASSFALPVALLSQLIWPREKKLIEDEWPSRIKELEHTIRDAVAAKEAAGDLEKMKKEWQEKQARFEQMSQYWPISKI